jgi:hypothetical protein
MSNDSRDADHWAKPVATLQVGHLPPGAVNANVQGMRVMGPVHGFGQLWQKTYRIRFQGARVPASTVIEQWKTNFPKFWPKGNVIYRSGDSLRPGDVGVINTNAPGNLTLLSTGIYVIYADEISFSFITPQGHPWAGLVTFSSDEDDDATNAQVQVLVRANDPIYEIGMRMGMSKAEDGFWLSTLTNLAAHFNATGSPVCTASMVDRKVQWGEWKNILHNAGLRTALYTAGAPIRCVKRLLMP